MTDPLPADVREYIEWMADNWVSHSPRAQDLLAKYPKPQEPWSFPLPPRFHDHAVYLRKHADWLDSEGKSGARFRTIAAEMDPEVPDA